MKISNRTIRSLLTVVALGSAARAVVGACEVVATPAAGPREGCAAPPSGPNEDEEGERVCAPS